MSRSEKVAKVAQEIAQHLSEKVAGIKCRADKFSQYFNYHERFTNHYERDIKRNPDTWEVKHGSMRQINMRGNTVYIIMGYKRK